MTSLETGKLRATIVIEWENIQLAEESRCYSMLNALTTQIDELHEESAKRGAADAFEVVILYDQDKCSDEEMNKTIGPFFPKAKPHRRLRLLATPGRTYYEQKNVGVREASADIVVLLDSDVIPQSGWLNALLSPFADPTVNVIAGNTYLSTPDPYSKAFAAFWFFELKAQRHVFEERRIFFANNSAFRREVLLKYPFPVIHGTTRDSCYVLSRQLRENGIAIYHNSAAQVDHPAPCGYSHFVIRALAHGRDHVISRRALGKKSYVRSFAKALILVPRSAWKILKHRRRVGLSWIEMPAALCVGMGYNLLVVVGVTLTSIAPGFTRGRWKI